MIFNKQIKTKEEYNKIKDKIQSQLGFYKHPKNLTNTDIEWLKNNIEQFDQKVIDEIISNSILSDKPKEE